jgi:hypothetical protein
MKRFIALLLVAAFTIVVLAPPVSATCPNPKDPRYVRGGSPYGDGGGWGDPVDNNKGKSLEPFAFCGLDFVFRFNKFFIITVIDNSNSQDRNDAQVPHSLLWER